jgi:hypothetical protein
LHIKANNLTINKDYFTSAILKLDAQINELNNRNNEEKVEVEKLKIINSSLTTKFDDFTLQVDYLTLENGL